MTVFFPRDPKEVRADVLAFARQSGRPSSDKRRNRARLIKEATPPANIPFGIKTSAGIMVTVNSVEWVNRQGTWMWRVYAEADNDGSPVPVNNPLYIEPVLLHVHPGGREVEILRDEQGNKVGERRFDVDPQGALRAQIAHLVEFFYRRAQRGA